MSANKTVQQGNDLKSIGLILKKKREELSYTLEHVSEITRITLTCLRNIEEGNMSALPGLVFVRGFIRNYAKLLGLESDWMIEGLNQTYTEGGEAAPQKAQEPVQQVEEKSSPKRNTLFYGLGIAVLGAVIAAVYFLYNQPSEKLSLVNESVETVQAVDPQEELLVTPQGDSILAEDEASPEQTESAVAPIISPLTLTLIAQDNDWIRLAIDGQDAFELQLKEGEKYEWPAEKEYALIMTTGSTATVHLNGEEIVDRESHLDQLYEVTLNKFTLKQINNQQ